MLIWEILYIGRWNAVDPLAEKTHDPYSYVWNNPMKFLDPDGRAPMDDITVNKYGKIIKIVRNDSPNRFFNEKGKQLFLMIQKM